MNNKPAIGIMFRIPEYGKVKKRLAIHTGDELALHYYKAMLQETIIKLSRLTEMDIYGFYYGDGKPENNIFKDLKLFPQSGRDLGERMFNAIKTLFNIGYEKSALIGADSPDLPEDFIIHAFEKLNHHDLVIGPSMDGGYYLIAMKKPFENIFKGINWGTERVLKETLVIVEKGGIKYALLQEWYDIDDIDGLRMWFSGKTNML